jgi:hypothetical protein
MMRSSTLDTIRTLWLGALGAALAGCPAPGAAPQAPAAATATAASGCPAAGDVYVASYLTQDDHAATDAAAAGHTGWVLPLHDAKVEAATRPEYQTIDAAAAAAAGVPVAPKTVWLMAPSRPPCKATIGSYYAASVDSPTPNVAYGVELSGCAAPPKEEQQDAEAMALVADQAPVDCQILVPQPVAARLGELDAKDHWQRPTKETPIPPALAAAIPPHDCRPPGCETLWTFAEIDVASRPIAWAGAVNWLTIPPNTTPASQCDWKADTFAGFFVPGVDGKAVKVTEGQDHPLLLSAALADRSGGKLLIAEGSGEYAIYELMPTGAKLARHQVWLTLGPEAYKVDERIGPACRDDEHH